MKYKTTVAALLLALAGTNAMASSVHVQIAPNQHFNQFVNKAQSKDNIEIELQVQNLNHEDEEARYTSGLLQYLTNDKLKGLSIDSLDVFNHTAAKPQDLYAFRIAVVDTTQNNVLFKCQQITNVAKFTDSENYILNVNSIDDNQCQLIKIHA